MSRRRSRICRALEPGIGLLGAGLVLLACGSAPRERSASAPAREVVHAPRAPDSTEAAPPLADATADSAELSHTAAKPEPQRSAPAGSRELPLQGFLPALVDWPSGGPWPQPVLMAAHGAGDSAEAQCASWRSLLGDRGVILCLRGRAIRKGSDDHGYYFPNHLELEREALAALSQLSESYPELVDARRILYAGYSQGAQMGLLMLAGRGALAPRLLLVEGGAGDFTLPRVRRFAASGGERVAFVCGTPSCTRNAERSRERLAAAQVAASVRHRVGGGHAYWGPITEDMAAAFAELTADDPRWSR